MQMSQKGTMKIGNNKKDMILQNPRVRVGRMQEKERGEKWMVLFQELLLLSYNPLAPSGGQGQNNMSVKKKYTHTLIEAMASFFTAPFFSLKYISIKIKEK